MPEKPTPELLMPVSDQGAALQFFVEAMKANTAVLERVGKALQGVQAEQKETLKLLHDTRERVIRMEGGSKGELILELREKVKGLDEEIADLKSTRDRNKGAVEGVNALLKYGPVLIVLLGAIAMILRARGEL